MTHKFGFVPYLTIATLVIKSQPAFMRFYRCIYETSNSLGTVDKCHIHNFMMNCLSGKRVHSLLRMAAVVAVTILLFSVMTNRRPFSALGCGLFILASWLSAYMMPVDTN